MTTDLLEELLAAARAHGEASDPEHEVGDLQGLLASCWARLSEAQKRDVYEEHVDIVRDWLGRR